MILDVRHRTAYRYSEPVSVSHHLLHLFPRSTTRQACLGHTITVAPEPSAQLADTDYFGNPTTFLAIETSHTELVIDARSHVEVQPPAWPAMEGTAPWEEVVRQLRTGVSRAAVDAFEYSFASAHVPILAELFIYAQPSFAPGKPILAAASDLSNRIFRDFRYDPEATTLATPVAEAFALRRGVCQDFAHIAIACLRARGLAARYVSGYLLTRPPEGKPRRIGADASHAWIGLWLGEQGWVDLDPTNDVPGGEEHVTLAWGRDYADVAPVSGVMFGGGAHTLEVAVDVEPLISPEPGSG